MIESIDVNSPHGSHFQVDVFVNVDGTLSAQLEGARRQVNSGSRGDDPSNVGPSRVENVVETLLETGRNLFLTISL